MNFFFLIYVKMPKIVGILTFMSRKTFEKEFSVLHLDQRSFSAMSPELKKSGSFPLTHSSTAVMTGNDIHGFFFKFGNRKNSLAPRSGE